MTALAPLPGRAAGGGPARAAGAGRSGSGTAGPVGWMVLPALAMFVLFALVPLLGVLGLSFVTWDGIGGPITPAGVANWTRVLRDPGLPHALGVTFLVMALSWVAQTPLSLLLGVFMAGRQRYRALLAVFYFLPLLLSSAAIAIVYKSLLDPNFGIGPGLHSTLLTQDWLGRPHLALGVLVFIVSWQFVPFHSLIYQGGVRQIPDTLYEAAALDGAGRVRAFLSITLPQLKYTIITSSTLMVVGSLTFFDLIWVLTGGGPGDATRVLAVQMYVTGFGSNLMGPASVIAVILVALGLLLALLLRRLGGSTTDSQLEGM